MFNFGLTFQIGTFVFEEGNNSKYAMEDGQMDCLLWIIPVESGQLFLINFMERKNFSKQKKSFRQLEIAKCQKSCGMCACAQRVSKYVFTFVSMIDGIVWHYTESGTLRI